MMSTAIESFRERFVTAKVQFGSRATHSSFKLKTLSALR